MYTAITPPYSVHGKSTRQLHGRVRAVNGRLDGRPLCGRVRAGRVTCRVPVTRRPCSRPVNTSSPAKTVRTRPYNGRAVYTARTRPCMGRAYGPSTPPMYMTVYGPSAWTSSAVYMERTRPVHGTCTRPCTGRVHGRLRAVHTAVYTTRIRPRTRVYVYTAVLHGRVRAIYTAENGRLHGCTRPCNVSCIRQCTGRIGSCTRQSTGRVLGRFRPCTLAVYTAVFGRLHSAYTAV